MPSKRKTESGNREPLSENVGAYLYNLRMLKNVSRQDVADHLTLSPHTIRNVENNELNVPQMRLKLWLQFLDAMDHYDQITSIMRTRKTQRKFNYTNNNKANEHIDRIIDAYEHNRLNDTDLALLRMVAPYEYNQSNIRTDVTPETKDLDVSVNSPVKINARNNKRLLGVKKINTDANPETEVKTITQSEVCEIVPVTIITFIRFLEDTTIPVTREQARNWINLSFSRERKPCTVIGIDNRPPKHKEGLYLVYRTESEGIKSPIRYMALNEVKESITTLQPVANE